MKIIQKIAILNIGVIYLLMFALLGGCASTDKYGRPKRFPEVRTIVPVTTRLATYQKLLLDVSTEIPEPPQTDVHFEEEIIKFLKKRALFKAIVTDATSSDISADLRLNVKLIKRYKEKNKISSVVVESEFIDLKTGENNGVFRMKVWTVHPSFIWIFGDQLNFHLPAELLVDYLVKNM
jgi:hypothetical protein